MRYVQPFKVSSGCFRYRLANIIRRIISMLICPTVLELSLVFGVEHDTCRSALGK